MIEKKYNVQNFVHAGDTMIYTTYGRNHPGNQYNKEHKSQPAQNLNQGEDIHEKTNKLEETLNQFMHISMSNYRSTKASIKNLEMQVGQLAKQMAERPSSSFGANTEKNPKEECKAILTRSQKRAQGEAEAEKDQSDEGRTDRDEEREEGRGACEATVKFVLA